MHYRRLGNSGLKVSALGLGGWLTFGDSIQDAEIAQRLITTAYEGGVNFFEIAQIDAICGPG